MYYFEYLRLRKGLIVFTAIAGAIVLFQMLSLPFSHVSGNGDNNFGINIGGGNVDVHAVSGFALVRKFAQSIHVPFALVCAIAGLLAVIFGTSAATSLNRQNAHAHFEFTKPVSRVRLALTTIGCDLAAIGIAFAVTVVLILIPFAVIGIVDRIRFDASALFVTGVRLRHRLHVVRHDASDNGAGYRAGPAPSSASAGRSLRCSPASVSCGRATSAGPSST